MAERAVAKIWWEAPHDGGLELFMTADDVITFGRGGECAIRVGYAPVYQAQVPRVWGEISWHRGAVFVRNVSSHWGLALVPAAEAASGSRVHIPPGAGASSPTRAFSIVAKAPDFEVSLFVQSATGERSALAAGDDPPSFVPFALTPTQKIVGAAVIAPLLAGAPRRASYTEIAAATHYAVRTVREAIAALDGLFVLHNLVEVRDASGDALDRVAHVLRLHPTLLGAS